MKSNDRIYKDLFQYIGEHRATNEMNKINNEHRLSAEQRSDAIRRKKEHIRVLFSDQKYRGHILFQKFNIELFHVLTSDDALKAYETKKIKISTFIERNTEGYWIRVVTSKGAVNAYQNGIELDDLEYLTATEINNLSYLNELEILVRFRKQKQVEYLLQNNDHSCSKGELDKALLMAIELKEEDIAKVIFSAGVTNIKNDRSYDTRAAEVLPGLVPFLQKYAANPVDCLLEVHVNNPLMLLKALEQLKTRGHNFKDGDTTPFRLWNLDSEKIRDYLDTEVACG